MSDPEFSVKIFRRAVTERTIPERPLAMSNFPDIYWDFYSHPNSAMRNLNELQILAMSDEDIEEAYAKWRIES